ncbi:MAG: extracellular solute-binding protein [Bacilli bacterium]|nr:extracellular solute-binding protein [Bacilli bacterium]
MSYKKVMLLALSVTMISGCTVTSNLNSSSSHESIPSGSGSAEGSTSGESSGYIMNITKEDVAPFVESPVNIKFWNPITGPDAGNLQNLVRFWNDTYGNYIKISNDPLAENDHYTRLLTSFADNSTADLTIIHSSRVPIFQKQGKLRPMTNMLSKVGIAKEQYLESIWNASVYGGDVYALAWDIIPTVFYYNRYLLPEGYTEEMIHSDDFTVETMREMMKAAYVHNPVLSKRTYGMAFNYAFTENPFISMLYQMGGKPVEEANPTVPTFNGAEGVAAAEALRSIPFTQTSDGYKAASESGSNHLNIFRQGRALFTIDGLWSTNSLVAKNEQIDTGVAFLPKVDETATRSTYGDSHVFATFTNNSQSDHKDNAIGLVMKFLVDNSIEWYKGGKVAVRNADIENATYKAMPWAFISQKLDKVVLPQKLYTYSTITGTTGEYISKLCEGTLTDVQAALNECASDAEDLAKNL